LKTVSITLNLTYKEVAAVMAFLNNMPSDFNRSYSALKQAAEDESSAPTTSKPSASSKPSVTPTAGKKTKMPTFGRTQSQIDSFAKQEEKRLTLIAEKEKLKADKLKTKAAADNKTKEEVKAIKAQQSITEPLPKKPWEL